jgi:hypothetical protein
MRTLLTTLAAMAMLASCGGSTSSPGDGGPGSSSGGSSGGTSGSSSGTGSSGSSGSSGGSSSGGSSSSSGGGGGSACPTSPPASNGSCTVAGLTCEYGSSPELGCNQIFTCMNGSWEGQAGADCVTGTCPTSYSSVPQGQDCSPQGLDCGYPEGQCNCSFMLPVGTNQPKWQCMTPMQGCPDPRPDLGTACSQAGLMCDYGGCTGGVVTSCENGYWQQGFTACPGERAAP